MALGNSVEWSLMGVWEQEVKGVSEQRWTGEREATLIRQGQVGPKYRLSHTHTDDRVVVARSGPGVSLCLGLPPRQQPHRAEAS